MMKKAVLKKHSRHVALLTAIVLAFSNVGSCMTVSFADEITSESGSGSGSEGSSSSGSESGSSSSGSESGGSSSESGSEGGSSSGSGSEGGSSSGSGSEGGSSSGSGSEGGSSSGSGSESGGSSGSGTEGEGETGSGTEGEGETGSGTEGEGETGSGTEGEGETGSGTEGEGETGSGTEGEGETGSGTEGEGETGSGTEGEGETGSGTEGEGENGSGAEGGEEAGNEDESTAGGAAGGAGAANGPEVEKEFTVTYMVNPENAAIVEGESEVIEGEELVFTVEPQDGYAIQNVTANGYEVLAEADDAEENNTDVVTYVVSSVDDDLDIEVEMSVAEEIAEDEVSISATADDGAVITVSGSAEAMGDIESASAEVIDDVDVFIDEINAELESKGEKVDQIVVYDVMVMDANGNEVQPDDEVRVIITAPDIVKNNSGVGAFHAKASDVEEKEYEIEIKDISVDESEGTIEIETAAFSPVGAYTTRAYINTYSSNDYVSGDSKWNAELPEIKETSQGIIIEVNKSDKIINVIIPMEYSGDINVNVTEAIQEAWSGSYMPGGAGKFYSINIQNASGHSYKYKDGSMIIATFDHNYNPDTDHMYDYENGVIDGGAYIATANCFDGNVPFYSYSISRTDNLALRNLYNTAGKLKSSQLTDSAIAEKLQGKGYENGIEDLDQYYLDFFNTLFGHSYTRLEDFSDTEIAYTKDGKGIFGGYDSGIKETNSQVAELGYNFFYNRLVGIAPESAEVYAGGSYGAYNGVADYSIGAYMRGEASYNEICLRDLGAIGAGENAALEAMGFYISGPYCTNPFQRFDFGFSLAFELEQTDVTPDVPTPPNGGGSGGGGGGGSTPGGRRATPETNGPGITIEPEAVPLAPLPEITIPENEVPLAPLPKTGDSVMSQWICLMSGLLLGMYGLFGRKKEDF